ncbi:uncharacterized protein PGTG_18269 [Puccinia graminis f. sp. tritici CRL 75-36-700-3]|uniref:cellulase n=1 Tax=Puccinia graminis f. sp. tritici (strain CRL 75-36-700-3 / race SCCL) TaxID=418459 RepID=E3L7B9_PUCGT|nr:uncharacterized protein PGTG_18269 [Puccinia graminis f. sp. tritici CRL 75-36-700-3]EFP92444.2 hypothetical protein PGTG_18269 [Puccinia graminis f. sp. tritici CRL 75-36-700-3]
MAGKQTPAFWQGLVTLFSFLSLIFSGAFADETAPGHKPGTADSSKSAIPRLVGVSLVVIHPRKSKINLPGFEFGAQPDGQYLSSTNPPMPPPESQIAHFLSQNVNFFRVPVAWEFLQPEMNGKLNDVNLKAYKTFIEKITTHGAYVAIDLHAFARYKGQIVGESPTTPASALVSLWTQLGAVFKDNPLVMFGISNEPHDLVITTWATTVQKVVTALREKKIQNILLIPGTDYTALKTFPDWYEAMKVVKNPDGSFDGLVMEVHRYLDTDNSGTSPDCTASHADEVAKAVQLLKADGRQVILGETGGGSTDSCMKFLPELAAAVTDAYPVVLGFALWAAGSFDANYMLVTTVKDESSPTGWKDQGNWNSIKKFIPAKGSEKTSPKPKPKTPQQTSC